MRRPLVPRQPAGALCRCELAARQPVHAGAGAAGDVPTPASAWCAAQLSKSAGVTVNVLNRMFAWLAPQYSTHAPLNALAPAESGVYHR